MRWYAKLSLTKCGIFSGGFGTCYLLLQKQPTALYAKTNISFDFENYKSRYPSDFIHGLLSSHAYIDSKKNEQEGADNPVKIPTGDAKEKYNQYLTEWQIDTVFDQYKQDYSYYYAASYVNVQDKQLVLAHRGTTIPDWKKEFTTDNTPWGEDLVGIFGGHIIKQQIAAYKVTKEVCKKAQANDYALSMTGHSLGAWLAEMGTYYSYKDKDFGYDISKQEVKCVTFDSPGALQNIELLKSTVISNDTEFDIKNLNITTYLSPPNLINTCNKHVGKVYTVPTVIPKASWYSKCSMVMGDFQQSVKTLEDAALSTLGHFLDAILDTFDPITGVPREYRKVVDWPYITRRNASDESLSLKIGDCLSDPSLKTIVDLGDNILSNTNPTTFMHAAHTLQQLLKGNISLDQYYFYHKYKLYGIVLEREEDVKKQGYFHLRYQAHYKTEAVNPGVEVFLKDKLFADSQLNKLKYCSENSIKNSTLSEQEKTMLSDLKKEYHIVGPQHNNLFIQSSKYSIDVIREIVIRFFNEEIKEFISRSAFMTYEHNKKPIASIYGFDRISNYVTRENLVTRTDKALSEDKVIVITGIPGVGKSRFVDEYSRDQSSLYGTTVRYFDAQSEDMLYSGYLDLADDLDIERQEVGKEALIKTIKSEMHTQPKSMFIFDNVEKYEDIENYKKHLPENTQLIIISRNPQLFYDHIGEKSIVCIEPFSTIEATKYLETSFNSSIDGADINKLVQEVGGIPYQLYHTVMYLRNNLSTGVAEYIAARKKGLTGHDDPATAMLLDVLKSKEHGKLAWEMLQYVVYLEAGLLSDDIFENLFAINKQKTYFEQALGHHTYGRKDLNGALGLLTSLSLIEVHAERGRKFYKMHNQTQEAIRKYTESNHPNVPIITQKNLLSKLTETINNLLPDEMQIVHSQQLEKNPTYMHAIKLLTHLNNKNTDPKVLASLYKKLGDYYEVVYDFVKQKSYYTKNLEILRDIYKGNHPDIAFALDNLGNAYRSLEQLPDALFYHEKALEMRNQLYQGTHHDVVVSLNNIGNTYRQLGQRKEALDSYKAALQKAEELYPQRDHPSIAICFGNIGNTYHSLGKEKMSLANKSKKLGTMAEVAMHQNAAVKDFETALGYHNNSLKLLQGQQTNEKKVLQKIAMGLNDFGAIYGELGKLTQELGRAKESILHCNKALKFQKESLAKLKELYDDTHATSIKADIAMVLYNVGVNHKKLGQIKEGLEYEGEALKISQGIYKQHSYVADSLKHIGKVYQQFGDNNKALEYYISAYRMYQSLSHYKQQKFDDTKEKIRVLEPNFFSSDLVEECQYREPIVKNEFNNLDILTIQEKIQDTILNEIYLKTKAQEWGDNITNNTPSNDTGIMTYIDTEFIQKQLGNLNNQNNVEIAKMLCFEAISLGTMHSTKQKDLRPIIDFNKHNPELVQKILHEHPEYCVDGLILKNCTQDQELIGQLLGYGVDVQG